MQLLLPATLLLSALNLVQALPSPSPSTSAASKPYQLRGVSAPIFHLYLQPLPGSKSTPVMGPEATGEYYTIGGTIQSSNSSMYLNIGVSPDKKSYLPLAFGANATGAGPWALEGDTVITSTGSTYGRQLNFLVCANAMSGYYDLYLQTGADQPSGVSCSNFQTIHTPCLC